MPEGGWPRHPTGMLARRAGTVASRRRWRHERQPRRQPGELKRAVHIVCPAQDAQPVMRAQAGSGVDKDSDADRVDELQPAQIDDDLGRVRTLDAGKFIVQRMGALEIKLAAGRYDVRVAVARGPQRER